MGNASQGDPPVTDTEATGPGLSGARVLLVNGQPMMARLVARALRSAGCEVLTAKDRAEALEAVRRHPPDVVLVDHWMSGVRDIGLVRELAALTGAPIVVHSDPPTDRELREVLAAGAVDYVVNNALPRELLARVRRALLGGQQ